MKVLDIIRGTTVDGPGFRTSIYFAGCKHQCKGCHNPSSWDFNAGTEMSADEIMKIVEEEDFDVTFSGGDPLYHVSDVIELSSRINKLGHNIWIYTGFTWDEIIASPVLKPSLQYIDVLIDSPYIDSLRDADLLFRGSSNQHIIDVKKSLKENSIIEWTRE